MFRAKSQRRKGVICLVLGFVKEGSKGLFSVRHRTSQKTHKGFQTGDIVKAIVTKGKKPGTYTGRVLCRTSGSFDISTHVGRVAGISHKYCSHIYKKDGYQYSL